MPRGDKSKYTDKQERKADHIAAGYEERGVPEKEAERRAWATVNKDDGGGKAPGGSGRGKSTGHPASHKGGAIGGKASASRSAASRSASAKKAALTRKRLVFIDETFAKTNMAPTHGRCRRGQRLYAKVTTRSLVGDDVRRRASP